MGIIKAGVAAFQGAAADQWKEAFCAGEMGSDVLMVRAKKIAGQNSSNNGSGEVITDGSLIIVGEGECAVATEGGKVIGIYDQPGEQKFKSNQSSGFFGGGLGAFMKDVGRRISFGGDITISQKLYYINTKELTGGTIHAHGVPLRYKDANSGLDIDGGVNCYGSYTFRIADPEKFFRAAIRVSDIRSRQKLLQQMDNEVKNALLATLASMTEEGVRPSELLRHTDTLSKKLRQSMSDQWCGLRGIEVVSIALSSLSVLDAEMIRLQQRNEAFTDPTRAAAHLVGSQGDALRTAAANQAGGAVLIADTRPGGAWKCSCGAENNRKFCTACGAKKPADTPQNQCRKCGWKAPDQSRIPKFCPECGNPFNGANH